MCFSASASFIAGTSLSVVGVTALRRTKASTEIPFAIIPLLFGIQQLTEGVIWLTFSHDAPLLKQTMTYLYSGFSHVRWPMYVPFAMGVMESIRWRRKAIFSFEVAGSAAGLYLLYFLATSPVVAQIAVRHIVYLSPHFYTIPVIMLYLAATCVSCFFMALVSVWCFFAAILSLLIYLHLRFRDLGGYPQMDAMSVTVSAPPK